MAVFKTLNSQDVIISPLKVSKNFSFEGASALTASNVGIDRFLGTNDNFLTNQSLTGQVSQEYQVTVYNSTKQLYYTNYLSGSFGEISNAVVPSFNPDGTITPPSSGSQTYNTLYDNFETTTLNPQKIFPTESIGVISIPTKLFGDYIKPGSFRIESSVSGTLYDDGEGRVKSGSNYIGNIIYEHGIVIITDGNIITPTTTTTTTTSTTTTTTIAPTSGNKELILNIWNKTTESIDYANVNFNFEDSPNVRSLNTSSIFAPPVYYYISGSQLPIGKSTIKTKMNLTSSFTSSILTYNVEPDINSFAQIYTISSSFFTDGTLRSGGGVSSPTSIVTNQVSADLNFNPTTWTTMSLNITASYTSSVNKNIIVETQNNTTWYAGTASTNDIWVNRFDPWFFKQDTYPSGFLTTSGTRVISGSDNIATAIEWPIGYGRLSVTQSFFLDNVFYSSTSGIFDTALTTGVSYTPGAINYDNFQVIKSVTTINDAPITGSRVLEYRVKNNTTESIDTLWWAFDFSDSPNYREPTNPSILSGYKYYISASNIPVGDSVYRTIVNFTASLVQPPQNYNLYMDPDDASSVEKYSFTGRIKQDGVSIALVNDLTASKLDVFPPASYLNPMTWTTCSFELTASLIGGGI
jgi:hypothetical protein